MLWLRHNCRATGVHRASGAVLQRGFKTHRLHIRPYEKNACPVHHQAVPGTAGAVPHGCLSRRGQGEGSLSCSDATYEDYVGVQHSWFRVSGSGFGASG